MLSSINMDSFYDEIKQLCNDDGHSGFLLLGTDLTKEQIAFIAEQQPNIVVLDTCFETLNVDFVNMNSVLGAYQAASHFIKLGHQRIGYVQSNVRIQNFELRKQGFIKALMEHNLDILDKDYFSMFPTLLSAQEHLKNELIKRKNDLPTALFCESDYIAISVIKSLKEININIPEDISIIGFDNIHESKIISPELTTLHVPAEEMASLAVNRIIDIIENKKRHKMKYILDTKIIERKSCRTVDFPS